MLKMRRKGRAIAKLMRSSRRSSRGWSKVPLDEVLWQQLLNWAQTHLSLETQELINTLLIELYPELVDALNDPMGADENLDLTPDMPLIQLKQILETRFDWAIDA
jgi:hypothetical protein